MNLHDIQYKKEAGARVRHCINIHNCGACLNFRTIKQNWELSRWLDQKNHTEIMSWQVVYYAVTFSLCLHAHAYQTGATVELQSHNYPDYYIQPANSVSGGVVTIQRPTKPASWEMVSPSLCNVLGTVSFHLSSQGTYYLRYRNGLIYTEKYDGSSSFADSACFYIRYDKWFPGHAAIESVKSPGYFLRHQHSQLKCIAVQHYSKWMPAITSFSPSAYDLSHTTIHIISLD